MKIEKILYPTDFSNKSDNAREHAMENQLEKKMQVEKKKFESAGVSTEDKIIIGPRWKVINNFAKEYQIDLIVMGSHGVRTDSGEISVGTTSHKVMFSSPCPVLIVRHESD